MNLLIAIGLFAVAGAIYRHGRQHTMASEALRAALARLTGEVTETRGAAQSAITALNGIAEALREQAEASDGEVAEALNSAADELDNVQSDLGAAIPANPNPGEDTTGGNTDTGPVGEDTLAGGQGEDTLNG